MNQAAQVAPDAGRAPVDETMLWATLVDPGSDSAFHAAWLAILCMRCEHAELGLLVLRRPDNALAPAAMWPSLNENIKPLIETAEAVLRDGQPVVQPLAEGRGSGLAVGYPLRGTTGIDGVAVVTTAPGAAANVGALVRQMHWAAGLIESVLLRAGASGGENRLAASRKAFDIVTAIQDETKLERALLNLVNEVAVACRAERVAFGILRRDQPRLAVVSNMAQFDRRSDAVHRIELAMAECHVQEETIRLPAQSGTRRQIAAAHQVLLAAEERATVVSVPFVAAGRGCCGILTVEGRDAAPERPGEIVEMVQLIAALTAPYLKALQDQERMLAGRGPRMLRNAATALLGRGRLGIKLATLACAGGLAWLTMVPMPFWITARAVVEGEIQRAAVVPFDGYVQRASVRAGDVVTQGQEMMALDDRDLRFEKLKWTSERAKLDQRQREALAKFDRATAQVLVAQIDQVEAELRIVEDKLQRARIVAPIAGYVVSGDLSQLLGSPVQQGKVLFEIAPLDAFRVTLSVDEVDIRYLKEGMTGGLTLTGAGDALPLALTRLTSVTAAKDGRNTFRAEARLAETPGSLRPGMEGVAKIEVGQAPLLWSWSRTLLDRMRLFIWAWTP